MSEHEAARRGFYVLSEAWYGKCCAPLDDGGEEIMIGLYYPGGGTSGEFALRWHKVGGEFTPRLEIFNDAWIVLPHFTDLMTQLPELALRRPTPVQVIGLLKALKMEDLTERTAPSSILRGSHPLASLG